MKKKDSEVTADEMFDEADRRTQDSVDDARYECEAAWEKQIEWYCGEKSDYAWNGVFNDACKFFVTRERDLIKGVYAVRRFIMREEAIKILAFNFNYDYDSYSWNEKTYDLDNCNAFDYCSESDELPCALLKREVVSHLRSFLLTGAVLAKKIGSDTYVRWRKLIVDLDYAYDNFDRGSSEDKVEAFFKSMDEAAELYVIDAEVSARLDMTQRPKRTKKDSE